MHGRKGDEREGFPPSVQFGYGIYVFVPPNLPLKTHRPLRTPMPCGVNNPIVRRPPIFDLNMIFHPAGFFPIINTDALRPPTCFVPDHRA